MKLSIIIVGKTNETWLANGIEKYFKRIKHYVSFEILTVNDKNKGNLKPEECKKFEGEKILSLVNEKDYICLLDEKGRQFTSLEFSEWINKEFVINRKKIVFIIGGAYGFSPALYKRANCMLSLSSMTYSHQIIRLFFLEQLYRTFTILNNEPYHHT